MKIRAFSFTRECRTEKAERRRKVPVPRERPQMTRQTDHETDHVLGRIKRDHVPHPFLSYHGDRIRNHLISILLFGSKSKAADENHRGVVAEAQNRRQERSKTGLSCQTGIGHLDRRTDHGEHLCQKERRRDGRSHAALPIINPFTAPVKFALRRWRPYLQVCPINSKRGVSAASFGWHTKHRNVRGHFKIFAGLVQLPIASDINGHR